MNKFLIAVIIISCVSSITCPLRAEAQVPPDSIVDMEKVSLAEYRTNDAAIKTSLGSKMDSNTASATFVKQSGRTIINGDFAIYTLAGAHTVTPTNWLVKDGVNYSATNVATGPWTIQDGGWVRLFADHTTYEACHIGDLLLAIFTIYGASTGTVVITAYNGPDNFALMDYRQSGDTTYTNFFPAYSMHGDYKIYFRADHGAAAISPIRFLRTLNGSIAASETITASYLETYGATIVDLLASNIYCAGSLKSPNLVSKSVSLVTNVVLQRDGANVTNITLQYFTGNVWIKP